jgi:hypothetical protein
LHHRQQVANSSARLISLNRDGGIFGEKLPMAA